MAAPDHTVGTRTLRGMFWAYGSYAGGRALVLLSVAVLARLLSPSEFGLVAFALIVTAALDVLSDLGVSQALIVVEDDKVYDKADSAWTLSVLIGLGLTLVAAALGPLAAAFFDEPALKVLLPVLSLNFLLRALGVTHFALAQKQIDFRTRTVAELADVVVRGSTGVGLALAGAGAYSLVIGYLVGSAALTATLWMLVRWRPRIRLRREDLKGLLAFGGAVTFLDFNSLVISNADYVIVGRMLGKEALGFYTLGFRLPELVVMNLAYVAGVVLFPAFAGIDHRALGDAFLTALRYTLMVALPMALGLSFLAEPLVLIAFGDQWHESIPVMRVLTIFALAVALDIPAGTAYKSIGRVGVIVKLAVPRAVLVVASIGVFVDEGLVAVAACQAAVAVTFALFGIALASRLLGTGGRRILQAAWPPLAASGALAAVLAMSAAVIADPYVTLAVAVPVGAAAYLGALWLMAPEALRRLWFMAFPKRRPSALGGEPPLGRQARRARLIATGVREDPRRDEDRAPGSR